MPDDQRDNQRMESQSLTATAAKWLFGQEFNNVLLVLILSGGAWGLYYGITKAIPEHLTTIQAGYERIEEKQTEQLKGQQEWCEKMLDRMANKQAGRDAQIAEKK